MNLIRDALVGMAVAIGFGGTFQATAEPPKIIELWPGTAPGEKGVIGNEVDTTKPDSELIAGKRVIRLGNVSKPTIAIYRPTKQNDTGAAVLVCPGGGYHILAMDLEGTEVCEWLNSIGVTGVLLKYRVPKRKDDEGHNAPLQDAQRAIGLIRQHAGEWGIDPKRIGALGFSAGGHLVAALSSNYEQRKYEKIDEADSLSCKLDFSVLIYPGALLEFRQSEKLAPELKPRATTPPTFIAMAADDPVRVENALAYGLELKKAKVPVELHVYDKGGHGYGLRQRKDLPVTSWPDRLEDWMRSRQLLGTPRRGTLGHTKTNEFPVVERKLSLHENLRYFLLGPKPDLAAAAKGFGLVLILPGGDGGEDFVPFCQEMKSGALPSNFIAAELIAPKWSRSQEIAWPTKIVKEKNMAHSTEEFVEAVIDDAQKVYRIDSRHIFTLSWSSGGPAAYTVALSSKRVTGSFVAMSVFKPEFMPPLSQAKGRPFFLYHSPEDQVCGYIFALRAKGRLAENGATVEIKTYAGGHGWGSPSSFDDIRTGMEWLRSRTEREE